MIYHIKKTALVNGSLGWVKVADCNDLAELKVSLEALCLKYKRSEANKYLGPITAGELIRTDRVRVYHGAKWVGIAYLKRNGVCS